VDLFAGGIADKLGNRYEAKWAVRQLLDVIGGKAQSLRFEGIDPKFAGFEFAVQRGGIVEWHQTKISKPGANWTLAALDTEGVLTAFGKRLGANEQDRCIFVSQDPAKDARTLAEKANIASTVAEYEGALGQDQLTKFDELQRKWGVDSNIAFAWLKRCEFRTESQSSIESMIVTFSDFYFFRAGDTSFAILRDFLESRINHLIHQYLLHGVPRIRERLIYRLFISGDETAHMIGAWHVFGLNFQDTRFAPLAAALTDNGVIYRRLLADIASYAATNDEYRHYAEAVLGRSFDDPDKQVRHQAVDVFHNIRPDEFQHYNKLAGDYINIVAFERDAWAFYNSMKEATCDVVDLVACAAEQLIHDIKTNGNSSGRRSMDMHELQEIIKQEYAASEPDNDLRRRLLDIIDGMLSLEMHGVEEIIGAHER
jgi:hypothetical protein